MIKRDERAVGGTLPVIFVTLRGFCFCKKNVLIFYTDVMVLELQVAFGRLFFRISPPEKQEIS